MPADPFVRPFLLTGGRTRSEAVHLPVEVMVQAHPEADGSGLEEEQRSIVGRCGSPIALAEVAAHEGVPLGVARVLIGDLIGSGHLIECRASTGRDPEIVRRLLRGLKASA